MGRGVLHRPGTGPPVSGATPPGPCWPGPRDVGSGSDEERWAEALAEVARRPRTAEAARRGPAQLSRLAAVVGVLALLGAALLADHLWRGGPDWRQPVAWVLTGLLMALGAGGGLVAWRSRGLRGSWSDVRSGLTRRQRRTIAAQLRGAVPVDPATVPLVRERALLEGAQVGPSVFVIAAQLLRFGDLADDHGALGWLDLVLGSLWLGWLGWTGLRLRRARRFLLAHPEPVEG